MRSSSTMRRGTDQNLLNVLTCVTHEDLQTPTPIYMKARGLNPQLPDNSALSSTNSIVNQIKDIENRFTDSFVQKAKARVRHNQTTLAGVYNIRYQNMTNYGLLYQKEPQLQPLNNALVNNQFKVPIVSPEIQRE